MKMLTTSELPDVDRARLIAMLAEAYGMPHDDYALLWEANATPGTHFVIEENGDPVAHASAIERTLEAGGRTLRTGYVESVATRASHRRRGLATAVMEAAATHIRATYDLGALCSAEPIYRRLGWETWQGPTFVRTEQSLARTQEEDGNVLILRTPRTPSGLDTSAPISCEWRDDEVW